MKTILLLAVFCFVLVGWAYGDSTSLTAAQADEAMAMITDYHLAKSPPSLAYRAAAIQKMLGEANYLAQRLNLPTPRPIQPADIQSAFVSAPWFGIVNIPAPPYYPVTRFGTNIWNPSIPREQRLHAIKFGVTGNIQTTNFLFSFGDGRLDGIERLGPDGRDLYVTNIDVLFGKRPVITAAQARELATRWLAAVGLDVAALEKKYPAEVSQWHGASVGSTNVYALPIYTVHWGWSYFTNGDDNHTVSSQPLVQVKILGTTKELLELNMLDTSFSRWPRLLITNALELIRTPNPLLKQLKTLSSVKTNSANSAPP
jgi:hypothetical protein